MRLPILLSPTRVVDRLAADRLEPNYSYWSLLIATLIGGLAWPFPLPTQTFSTDAGYLQEVNWILASIAGLGVAYLGIRSCYRLNASLDGRAFIERFVVLFCPLSIWFGFGYAAFGLLTFVAFLYDESIADLLFGWFEVIWLVALVAFYVALHRLFRRLGAAIRLRAGAG